MQLSEMRDILGENWSNQKSNLVVVRSFSGLEQDIFNDQIIINDKTGGVHELICTANAGKWAAENLKENDWSKYNCNISPAGDSVDVRGGAHFMPGWTGEIWKHGFHHREYPALIQFRPAHFWADMGTFDRSQWVELFANGLQNIHYAAGYGNVIGHGSYGCIAIKDAFKGNKEWAKFYSAWESWPNARNFYYGAFIIDKD